MKIKQILLTVVSMFAVAGSAPAAGQPQLVIRDALGTVVGPVLRQANEACARYGLGDASLLWVAAPVPGTMVRLLLAENGPWDTKDLAPLLFESDDCSGAPLMTEPVEADAVRDAVIFDTRVYWPEGAGEKRVIRSKASLVRNPEDCRASLVAPQVCCSGLGTGASRLTAPAVSLPLVELHLSPPFRVEQDPGLTQN